jgi:hypothetical protein
VSTSLKNELFNILSGKSKISQGSIIQTISCYLKNGENSGRITENEKHFKEEEAKDLIDFIEANDLWLKEIDFTQYVSEGAEQRVYLKDGDHVLKLNDGIYYSSWKDYFYNLLLHNYFFPDTEYDLIGFTKDNDVLYAVVQQKYVTVNATTDLKKVKEFLESNGFQNNRNHDYIHKDLGIILEDLHDENVLTKNDILYFIDTVFYLTNDFWR